MSQALPESSDTAPILLLIDDDAGFRHVMSRALNRRGFAVHTAATAEEALQLAAEQEPEYVVLDLNLDGSSGLNLIQPLLERSQDARIVVLTGYASIPTAVHAIKLGARQYLAKPASIEDLLRALNDDLAPPEVAPDERMSVQRLEWEYIQRTLDEHGGNISATAKALNMHRRTLQRKLLKRPPQI